MLLLTGLFTTESFEVQDQGQILTPIIAFSSVIVTCLALSTAAATCC